MGLCGCFCWSFCALVSALLLLVAASWGDASGAMLIARVTSLPDKLMMPGALIFFITKVIKCKGDVKGCAYNEVFPTMQEVSGYETGAALSPIWSRPSVLRGSFEEFRRVAYDARLERSLDMFIGANMSDLPAGYIPDDIRPTFLNLHTADPERIARRDLLAEVVVATRRHPPRDLPAFAAPPHVVAVRDFGDKKLIHDLVGYNLFRQAFGVDLSRQELDELFEWISVMNKVAAGQPPADQGPRIKDLTEKFLARVAATDVGEKYLAQASARGMDGSAHLKELCLVLMFAGYGGTNTLVGATLQTVVADPALIAHAERDIDAVLLEGARLYPPVAGINPFVTWEDRTWTWPKLGGRTHHERKGDLAGIWSNSAHHDPAVFGGADRSMAYARTFDPTRKNLDRVLTWGMELRDIHKCESIAGCEAAPRPCPGTHLSYRVARQALQFFINGARDHAAAAAAQDTAPSGNAEL